MASVEDAKLRKMIEEVLAEPTDDDVSDFDSDSDYEMPENNDSPDTDLSSDEVYHGRNDKLDNSASAVVKRLLGSLQGKGHTVYVDSFYTSVQLAKELARANTGLVGTVMPNRKGLPKALKEGKLKKGEQIFRRKNDVLALRWKDKRDVWMISTRHTSSMLPVATREGNEKLKPVAVLDYNKHKAGVDIFDQRLSYGALDHKTVKWWRKLAFHGIIIAVSNGCILHNCINEKKLSTPKFIQEVCTALVSQRGERIEDSHGSATNARLTKKHFPNRVEMAEGKKKAQRRCVVCSGKQKNITGKAGRKDTSYECSWGVLASLFESAGCTVLVGQAILGKPTSFTSQDL
ncbi:piggyBac transposable element-derived protein 4-like [Schistocerca piceifrons]|uniref:piggyBac transposable element-derived protein 4-like n=1 Tax=Schistocerca piceifrons TaxID=274613 RepID=UPI001F5E711A|nr:piggyBac transposable element-derived protein 4-like [Schistocerca piceifrons]